MLLVFPAIFLTNLDNCRIILIKSHLSTLQIYYQKNLVKSLTRQSKVILLQKSLFNPLLKSRRKTMDLTILSLKALKKL
jgi:hypothetical protein